MKMEELKIDIYADGADIEVMCEEYQKGIVKGFTTNPSLMKKAGVANYTDFAGEAVKRMPDLPISFEVFADNFESMEMEARILAAYGENVFVKIPITNSVGESSIELIRKLSAEGIRLNITAVFTLDQVKASVEALSEGTENIISVFAGRISDTGIDPEKFMCEAIPVCRSKAGVKLLWASCREVFNVIQADRCGVDIITVTEDIMKKLPLLGKDLKEYSRETVQMFVRDGRSLAYQILPQN